MELFHFFNFLLLNLVVLATAGLVTAKFYHFQKEKVSSYLLATLLIFWTLIILLQVSLGAFGGLNYLSLSLWTYGICGWVFWLWREDLNALSSQYKKLIKSEKWSKQEKITAGVLFLPIAALVLVKAFNAAFQLPLEFDAIAYHLPFVAEWLQTGDLITPYYSAFAGPIAYYPSNYELFGLWAMLPFANDYFANLLNFPLLILLPYLILKVLENFKISRIVALVVSTLPLYMPVFVRQVGVPLVDLFFALCFGMMIYFLQEIDRKEGKSLADFFFFGLAGGLMIGTKYLGLAYAAPLVILIAIWTFWRFWGRKNLIFRRATVVMSGFILSGAYFYLRNWFDSGNPLFPVEVSFGGWTVLEGYRGAGVNEVLGNTSILANLDSWADFKEKTKFFFYRTGPFGLFSVLMPLVLLGTALIYWFQKKKSGLKSIGLLLLLALLSAFYFWLYLKAPYGYKDFFANIRYALPLFLLNLVALGYILKLLPWLKWPFYLAAGVHVLYSLVFLIINTPDPVPYTNHFFLDFGFLGAYTLALMVFLVALASALFLLIRCKKDHLSLLMMAIFLVSASGFFYYSIRERDHLWHYWIKQYFAEDQLLLDISQAAEWLNDNVGGDTTVAFSGFNFHYYFFGPSLENNVSYVNINECLDCRYVDYKDSADSIRRDPDFKNWHNNLAAKNKRYLVLNPKSTPGLEIEEYQWAEANPDLFELVFKSNDVYVYKISEN